MSIYVICPHFMSEVRKDPVKYHLGLLLRLVITNNLRINLDKEDKLIEYYKNESLKSNGYTIREWLNYTFMDRGNYNIYSTGEKDKIEQVCIDLTKKSYEEASIITSTKDNYLEFRDNIQPISLLEGSEAIEHVKIHENIIRRLQNSNTDSKKDILSDQDVFVIALEICKEFKHSIEENGLWKLLYEQHGVGNELHESAPQKIFHAISRVICKNYDVDVSPETDSGSGALDFKISYGYFKKVCVEIKYAKHPKLDSGYTKQIERYKKAEETSLGIYLVIDTENSPGRNLAKLMSTVNRITDESKPTLFVVNARKRKSASRS